MQTVKIPFYLILLSALVLLTGCGNNDSRRVVVVPQSSVSVAVGGAGVKGPLVGAVVSLYELDVSQADLQGALLGAGSTGSNAGIQGLTIPDSTSGWVVLVFEVDSDTTDLTTGAAPIFSSLTTVVLAQRVLDGDDIYASPLTTMAVNLARRKADSGSPYSGNSDGTIDEEEFTSALTIAQRQVKSTLGFGLDDTTDIFTTPPLITATTTDSASKSQVAAYRQAIEAVAAIANAVSEAGGGANAQEAFDALTEDLTDGIIDGQSDSGEIASFTAVAATLATIVTQDVTNLTIPGTDISIGDIESVLASETTDTGVETDVTDLESGDVNVDPDPAKIVSDVDGDGVPDVEDAFPEDPTEYLDSDEDGVGDNADVFPNDPNETSDSDQDGVGDNADAFPNDPTEHTDADNDGFGDNEDDLFPNNPGLQMDIDSDGVDDAFDNCVTVSNSNQADTDGDGAGDACDAPELSALIWDSILTTWDNAKWSD
ncbi:MAG: hypothetical protein COA71_10080 [SAR86 cluster bacterium]|uniref:Uncharacterized protein n=1 Tax=SAR86 cluster bacterium TaxID=2030880 RepID=A0A2A5CBP5_9GAMM|nr:MAG: hypothetical protein COA71_10080 [SAR86 cluster bacterium]